MSTIIKNSMQTVEVKSTSSHNCLSQNNDATLTADLKSAGGHIFGSYQELELYTKICWSVSVTRTLVLIS